MKTISKTSDSSAGWRELAIGERIKKGDEGRWPDGEVIQVPQPFWGKKIKRAGIFFRRLPGDFT